MKLADLFVRHRLPPVAGGVLDQAEAFVQGAAIVASWVRPGGGE